MARPRRSLAVVAVPNGQQPRRRRRRNAPPRGGGGGPGPSRSRATNVLANGVGAVPNRPFGSRRTTNPAMAWDAFNPAHLPLPRPVGPYTTIRLAKRFSSSARCLVVCPNMSKDDGEWTNVVAVDDVVSGSWIGASSNAGLHTVDMSGLGDGATLCPSAVSVQVMCPTALQTASGVVYAGVMKTQAKLGGLEQSWNDYSDWFVQTQSPRLLSASKLALRGVQVNSYPLNMAEVSKFTKVDKFTDSDVTYNGYINPSGWAPILINNANNATLEYLVTVEYRVRFDVSHPASAGHTRHPIADDRTWDQAMAAAERLGNGVRDIADVVANTGMAVRTAAETFKAFEGVAYSLA